MSRMNNDLISRTAVLQILYDVKDDDDTPKNYGTLLDIIRQIRELPVAFDKEKVIEELENYLFEKYCVEGDENISEIVEKGGII